MHWLRCAVPTQPFVKKFLEVEPLPSAIRKRHGSHSIPNSGNWLQTETGFARPGARTRSVLRSPALERKYFRHRQGNLVKALSWPTVPAGSLEQRLWDVQIVEQMGLFFSPARRCCRGGEWHRMAPKKRERKPPAMSACPDLSVRQPSPATLRAASCGLEVLPESEWSLLTCISKNNRQSCTDPLTRIFGFWDVWELFIPSHTNISHTARCLELIKNLFNQILAGEVFKTLEEWLWQSAPALWVTSSRGWPGRLACDTQPPLTLLSKAANKVQWWFWEPVGHCSPCLVLFCEIVPPKNLCSRQNPSLRSSTPTYASNSYIPNPWERFWTWM